MMHIVCDSVELKKPLSEGSLIWKKRFSSQKHKPDTLYVGHAQYALHMLQTLVRVRGREKLFNPLCSF